MLLEASNFVVNIENNEVTVKFNGVTTEGIVMSILTLMDIVQREDTDMDRADFAKFITELYLDEAGELEQVDSEETLVN